MRRKAGTRPVRGAKGGHSYAQLSGRAARQAQRPESTAASDDADWSAPPEDTIDTEGSSQCSSDTSELEGCSFPLRGSDAISSELASTPGEEESKCAREALDKEAEEEEALALRIAEEEELREFVDLQRARTLLDKASGETQSHDDRDEDFLPGLSGIRLSHGIRPEPQHVEGGQMLRSEATRHAARRALGDRLRHDVEASKTRAKHSTAVQPTPATADIDAILGQVVPEHPPSSTGQDPAGEAKGRTSQHAPRASRLHAVPRQGDAFLESFLSS